MPRYSQVKHCGTCTHLQSEPLSFCGFCPIQNKNVLKKDNAEKCHSHNIKPNYYKEKSK